MLVALVIGAVVACSSGPKEECRIEERAGRIREVCFGGLGYSDADKAIDAKVKAKLAQERAVDATVEDRVKESVVERVNNPPPNPNLAMGYSNRARGYYKAGEWQLAIDDLTSAIELGLSTDKTLVSAYHSRGRAYRNQGQYQTAINDATKAINIGGSSVALSYSNRGDAYYALEQYQDAINNYTKAIQLAPNNQNPAYLYNWRGAAYIRLGQTANAKADEAKACSLDSQYC